MWLLTAFLLGLSGSLHCAGMCGPLVLSLPLRGADGRILTGPLFYHSGRVGTYVAIGAVFGLAGLGFRLAGLQQALSVASGILLLMLALAGLRAPGGKAGKWLYSLRSSLTGFLRKKGRAAMFAAGCGNGLLPCGLVYAAIAGSLAQASIPGGALFMLLFGLGTTPLLLSLPFLKNSIPGWQRYGKQIITISAVIIGCLLILRGLDLGIPFISPQLATSAGNVQQNCH